MLRPIPPSEPRGPELLRRHYEIEKELARRLREAPAEDRRRLYAEVYDAFYRLPDLPVDDPEGRRRTVELQARALEPYLSPESVFLEVGGGDGALARALAPRVRRVYAVEASAEAAAGVDWPANAELRVADASRLGLDDGTVDLAYSCHFLEHLHPDDAAVHAAEVRRVLIPGGRYVVVTPSRLWGPHDISRYFDREPTGFHLREYTHGDLAELFLGAGFGRVEALAGIGRPLARRALWPCRLAEGVLGRLPFALRRAVMDAVGRFGDEPFRPLEQVIVAGVR